MSEDNRGDIVPGHPLYRYTVPDYSAALPTSDDVMSKPKDAINPQHYKSHPSGVEAITVTEHFNFCLGNAIKYIWRSGEKGAALEDLKKARWYLDREISRLEPPAINSAWMERAAGKVDHNG